MNYSVYKVYSDRGISGKDIKNRAALKELLKDAEERKFQMVISWKINRISRKLSDVLRIVDILEQNNIAFNSYSEQFDNSTPAGKMQFQMMALIGEFERGGLMSIFWTQKVKLFYAALLANNSHCSGVM